MSPRGGRFAAPAAAAAIAVLAAGAAPADPRLELTTEAGVALAFPLGPDGRWCLAWNHSVSGAEVLDCFRAEAGVMILERSRQPDYAAGLGDIPGRGRVVADGTGGYWIEDIEAPLPAGLTLRVGAPAVGHRLVIDGAPSPLPPELARRRVVIRHVDG